ncbi:MAG TPA: UDP-N-acetylglucosamine 2-epimerase (non-hydrolyzing) [Candidatus Polarisedimenticolaceae bacterium]|nr:UDP-N-acetylglucosamine 2-epimerase (non-hydrolyzing) [Candidatus Polarisedimenticolaceae bacterium]
MVKVLSIFGTRPEAIKMAPVLRELARHPERVRSRVCVSGQHRQMLDQVLELFGIRPDHDLDVMRPDQSPQRVAAAVLAGLEPLFERERPDWVLVQGDTTTVAAAALAAFYAGVRVGHVEAGLRTHNLRQPFPEELNRRLVDGVSELLFAPTETARSNLLAEGVPPGRIHVTGNSGIDALLETARRPYAWEAGPLAPLPRDRRLVLVTAHRRESFGAPLARVCEALVELAARYAATVQFVFPVHPNARVAEPVRAALDGREGLTLLRPLDYFSLVQLMKRAVLVLTDSGGLQEEAPSLGVPVLVLRDVTERPEGVEAGNARLVGTDTAAIVAATSRLLDDPTEHARMARAINPYGDGHAAERIVRLLVDSP